MSELRALIFDFDGVILESADIKTQAFRDIFAQYPTYLPEILRYHLDNEGESRYIKFRHIYHSILGKDLDERELMVLGNRFSEVVGRHISQCLFVKGARRVLEDYQHKYLFFIASGMPQEELGSILESKGISRYFKGTFGYPPRKKNICESIMRRWGLSPEEIVFIGDSLTDYKEAVAAGICFIGRTRSVDPFSGLDIIKIKDLDDLPWALSCCHIQ